MAKLKPNTSLGIGIIFWGVVFTWIGITFLQATGIGTGILFRRLYYTGPMLIALGIAWIIFPLADSIKDERETFTQRFDNTPRSHKIAWLVAVIIGYIIAAYLKMYI